MLAARGAVLRAGRLCEVCAEVVQVSGAGIMLMSHDRPWGSICTTDPVSAEIEELQFTLGEGPCVDAYNHEVPVLEPDLADPRTSRWLAFTAPAVAAGVRAIFGFPLRADTVRIGALNLYRDEPGGLSDEQYEDALVMADIVTETVLAMQADAEPGSLADELDQAFRYVVYQASGMVAAQLDIGVDEALARLRAYSFGSSRPLTDVAEDVVARRLRFDRPADAGGA